MPTRVAVISRDRSLCARVLDAVHVDSTCVGLGFRNHASARLALRAAEPQIVIIDGDIPDALDLCADLSSDVGCRVIVMAVPDDADRAVDALTAGARGVLFATRPLSEIPKAVDIVRSGQVWAPRHVVAAAWMRLKSSLDRHRREPDVDPAIIGRLSHREREVLRHTAAGLGNKEVAALLSISESTVKVHLTHIFQKLGLRGRGELAAMYFGHHPIVVRRLAN